VISTYVVNPLQCEDNYSAMSNNNWLLMGGLLYLVQRRGDRIVL